jgi:hypothetical protein
MGCNHSAVGGKCEGIGNGYKNALVAMDEIYDDKFLKIEGQLEAILTILRARPKTSIKETEGIEKSSWDDCSASDWVEAINDYATGRFNSGKNTLDDRIDHHMTIPNLARTRHRLVRLHHRKETK